MRFFISGVIVLLLVASCHAHPILSDNSVVNAASFMPVELPGGSVARGSIFTVFGEQLGPDQGIAVSAFPLGTALAGVSIKVTQGRTSVDAIPLFASATQVNAIMPSNAPLGEVAVSVTFPGTGGTSFFPAIVHVVPASFGIFTINSSGAGPAVIQNFISPAEQPLNSTRQSAHRGQVVTLWGTGLGAINAPDNQPPPVANLAAVQVMIADQPATQILYDGRSPCCSGVDQIVFEVPADAPLGCYVPVVVKTAAGVFSNIATMSIAREGSLSCEDDVNPWTGPSVSTGDPLGIVTLVRNSLELGSGQLSVTDTASARFETVSGIDWFFNPSVSMPAPGTCVVYLTRGASGSLPNPLPTQPIDAGVELILRGPNGARSIPRTNPGFYASLFATTQQPPLYLDPGPYTLESKGGEAVGPVTASLDLPTLLNWTNKGDIDRIDRSQGIFLTWAGGDPARQFVRILGVSGSSPNASNNVAGSFVCSVALEQGSFTVPPAVLANLPISVSSGALSTGFLLLGTSPKLASSNVTATGLDHGFVTYQSMVGKAVRYP